MDRRRARLPRSGRRPFFSLKWKAVLLLSLILAAVNLTLVWMNLWRLEEQFDHQRRTLSERQLREFEALVEHSFSNLERVAPLLADLGSEGDGKAFHRRLVEELDQRIALLEIDWDITTLMFMDTDRRLHYHTGGPRMAPPLRALAGDALETESVQRLLLCLDHCGQFVAVPLLHRGRLAGALVLGRTVADAVYGFRRITGSDLAFLARTGGTDASGVRLEPWERRLALASSADRVRPLLQAVAARVPLEEIGVAAPHHFRFGGRHYDILRIAGRDLPWRDRCDHLVITDITGEVEYIDAAHRQSLLVGFAGFFLSEALLLMLLSPPLNRLRRLASILPRLAEGRDPSTEAGLLRPVSRRFADEIDVAARATALLARRLEILDRRVAARTRSLEERTEALTRERDFVAGLLRSAQVAILTLDREGRIRSVNPEGEHLTGRPARALSGRRFTELLEAPSGDDSTEQALEALVRGTLSSHQHEARIRTPQGQVRTISWVHSRLPGGRSMGEAAILSVGLDVTQRKEAERCLAWLADHDPLTELVNRRRFQEEFEAILARALRYRHQGALLFFDLDQFKYVNDTSGHQAGDLMLQMVASTLRRLVRDSDLLARLGGDEFALVMPQTDAEGACQMASRILEALARVELPAQGHVHRVSASIGITLFPDHGTRVQDLMAHADLAMYQAKEVGRGRWHLFSWDEERRQQLSEEVHWKQRIENALDEGRMFLEYQPIMEIGSGRVTHYEVLVRMREPGGGVSLPGRFIPVAERTGLIHRIDRLVLERTLEVLAAHPDEGFVLSVNLSGKVLDEQHFLPQLERLLAESGVPSQRLLIEITETAALADMPAAARLMAAVRQLGCRTALDDFGAGFSSFYYLRELSLDMVKIDGSFIRNLPRSREDRLFVRAITEVAQGLGKQTIAEFVEDAETLEMLAGLGVDYAQGYHVGRPGPLPEPAVRRTAP